MNKGNVTRKSSGILSDILRENDVIEGCSSFGEGLSRAVSLYMMKNISTIKKPTKGNKLDNTNKVQTDDQELEDSFYVIDIGVIVTQFYQWRRLFPRVEPYYAVKCNPDPVIIKTLAKLGCNFDCASKNEFCLVQDLTSDLHDKPDIIFANPCKPRSHIIEAVCKGIKIVTFDNESEIIKCASISKSIELILRIITDDRGSQCRLSSKFGARRAQWETLLRLAQKYGMKVIGVSFHVGSGCNDVSKYIAAINDANDVFELAEKKFGMKMSVIDIGGGFSGMIDRFCNTLKYIDETDEKEAEGDLHHNGQSSMTFSEIAEMVALKLDTLFPPERNVRIIGEPGRYFVEAAATLCCPIMSISQNNLDDLLCPVASDCPKPPLEMSMNKDSVASTGTSDSTVWRSDIRGMKDSDEIYCSSIIDDSKADLSFSPKGYTYYINDGVYGSFKDKLLYDVTFKPEVFLTSKLLYKNKFNDISYGPESCYMQRTCTDKKRKQLFTSDIIGPTGTCVDIICQSVQLPKLNVGDCLYFTNMGAYTMAVASSFSGFTPSEKVYVCSVLPEYLEIIFTVPETATKYDKEFIMDEEKKEDDFDHFYYSR